jgi:DNA helicase-2/ATP-dependent DNA helicase PcrA
MDLEQIIRNKHTGDKEQLDFIFSDDDRIIVTAPAGCGKTTAMVSKIAWNLSNGKVPTNKKILAMTFSVNAATKIKEALEKLLPDLLQNYNNELDKVEVANYHNFAIKLLYKHGYLLHNEFLNLDQFQIVPDYSQILDKYLITSQGDILNDFVNAVNNLNYNKIKQLTEPYYKILYEKLLPNHIITYNGILICANKLLDIETIKKFYQQYFKILIVDEFQDTNYLSFMIINKLIGDNSTFLLGDDIQKIYGFLGAIRNIFPEFAKHYQMKEIEFLNNYRFSKNEKMKELDKFIRAYGTTYAPTTLQAKINVKVLDNEDDEAEFILKGINKILTFSREKVAILVRGGKQADFIVNKFNKNTIPYFNAIFNDTDMEYTRFHEIALDVFYSITNETKTISKKLLRKCKNDIEGKKDEVCTDPQKEYIYYSLLRLLDALFIQVQGSEFSGQERYERINFILVNNSLKHMMEYIDERIVITTIHSAKGLEWDYVIIPKLMGCSFPTYNGTCKECKRQMGCRVGQKYCEFTFPKGMEKEFKEEISVFYVGLTRAKKDIYVTANTGINRNGYFEQTSCFLNLPGIKCEEYEW